MRLIDADALPKIKFHPLPYTQIVPSDADKESYKRGWNDAVDAIVECTDTIDPVKHGKWINDDVGVHCSECFCGWKFLTGIPVEVYGFNYCSYCGAKMDGGEDEQMD